MIALEKQRPGGPFFVNQLAAGWRLGLDVLLDFFAVELHADEFGVLRLLPAFEARGLEDDVKGLPFAGSFGGVGGRLGGAVNRADVALSELVIGAAEAVENLHFV